MYRGIRCTFEALMGWIRNTSICACAVLILESKASVLLLDCLQWSFGHQRSFQQYAVAISESVVKLVECLVYMRDEVMS